MPIIRLLRERRDEILDEWEAEVRRPASQSATFSRADLRDDIPSFLDRLADWLETGSSNTGEAVDKETTGRHALHRLQHGVELRYLIHEFRLLRRVILRQVTQSGEPGELKGVLARLDDALDHAMTESVAAYAAAREEAREMVLAVLSHDLLNPLSAISMSAASLLKSGNLNTAEVNSVSRIARAADRATRMMSDLLDLARSRFGGRMTVRREPMDLAEVARQATEELQLAHPDRAVEYHCDGDVRGNWDRDRIAQVISNLVGNAIRHGRDPISVSVGEAIDWVEIQVANHGPPIPKELIPSLFEPYRQATEADNGGVGLGLFIVAEIVRAHAGTISVDSNDERTVFAVRLPKRPAERPHAPPIDTRFSGVDAPNPHD